MTKILAFSEYETPDWSLVEHRLRKVMPEQRSPAFLGLVGAEAAASPLRAVKGRAPTKAFACPPERESDEAWQERMRAAAAAIQKRGDQTAATTPSQGADAMPAVDLVAHINDAGDELLAAIDDLRRR